MYSLDSKTNQPFKFGTKNWVKNNDVACRTYNTNTSVQFKTTILNPNLYDYGDECILI